MQTFRTANLNVMAVAQSTDRICYVLYPMDFLGEWIEQAAGRFGVSIAVITGMDWDDDLTPWPAPGQPPGCPDFKGDARTFLDTLTQTVIPAIDRRLGIAPSASRTLAGVSLSGLFTLWQWLVNDTFDNIISLSGSFWYEGFASWVKTRELAGKDGKAYFLLGNQEAHTNVRAFQPVRTDTEEIVKYLRSQGVDATFELVPGNHYQYPEQRLNRAFSNIFS